MDIGLLPSTSAGRELAWLMALPAEPSGDEIRDHLCDSASLVIDIEVRGWSPPRRDLSEILLTFASMVRALPGTVSRTEDSSLCVKLEQDDRPLWAVITVDQESKIVLLRLSERLAEEAGELDRIRQLYDLAAGVYEHVAAEQAHYWPRARAWLKAAAREGAVVLDVGCGPGHLVADLPPSVRVFGCDVSPEMVRAAKLARPAGDFAVHDYHEPLPPDWPPADVTVALGCLEFCTDLSQVIRNLAAATKPDGRLLLTVPRAAPSGPYEVLMPSPPLGHLTIHLKNDTEVETAFSDGGLTVLTHDIGPGFAAPDMSTVEYGYWELTNTRL